MRRAWAVVRIARLRWDLFFDDVAAWLDRWRADVSRHPVRWGIAFVVVFGFFGWLGHHQST